MWKIDLSCGGKIGVTFVVVALIVCLSALMLFAVVNYARAIARGEAGGSARYGVFAFGVVGSLIAALVAVAVWVPAEDLCDVVVEDDGTWLLKNPYGTVYDRIPGTLARSIVFEQGWRMGYSGGVLRTYDLTRFWIRTQDGRAREFDTLDGDRLLDRLGYDPVLCPLEPVEGGAARIATHRFGPWGPICGTAPPPYSEGQAVLGQWESDGWWYPTTIASVEPGRIQVRWSDGSNAWLVPQTLAPPEIPTGWSVQAKWGEEGRYFDCRVGIRAGDTVEVTWTSDGSTGTVRFDELRARPGSGGAA